MHPILSSFGVRIVVDGGVLIVGVVSGSLLSI